MRVSKKSEYALRALIHMGCHRELESFNVGGISKAENIPLKFLEQILLSLKNAGYLTSRRGVKGGYTLSKKLSEIRVGHIIRLMDGPLAPVLCVSQTSYEKCNCPDEKTCGLRLLMLDVRNSLANLLDNYTVADVVHRVETSGTDRLGGLNFEI
ncbi:Rrf2 family transcriptional regulator [Kamptonema cortianum]|nr:Rrf2 family transcriptional regulator [Oscillatoria laete-virens]MDK3160272.1 Rrf2 family transcriptional regulator [Kamptonema cortianum]MDL5054258.1 Rrf2 family transcriptional regulator [Oscillatoria laete-virens NRMC-F 0139]